MSDKPKRKRRVILLTVDKDGDVVLACFDHHGGKSFLSLPAKWTAMTETGGHTTIEVAYLWPRKPRKK